MRKGPVWSDCAILQRSLLPIFDESSQNISQLFGYLFKWKHLCVLFGQRLDKVVFFLFQHVVRHTWNDVAKVACTWGGVESWLKTFARLLQIFIPRIDHLEGKIRGRVSFVTSNGVITKVWGKLLQLLRGMKFSLLLEPKDDIIPTQTFGNNRYDVSWAVANMAKDSWYVSG